MDTLQIQKAVSLENSDATNRLFPIFLKLETLRVLVVGAGNVGLEKLRALLQNAPSSQVRVVAKKISPAVEAFAKSFPLVQLVQKEFALPDLNETDLVILALNDRECSRCIREAAKAKGLLVNVADTPDLCDFYLGSVVQKGAVKIAISTNGQSPTMAKRLKEVLNDALPAEINELTNNLHHIRNRLNGNFENKVKQLNELTKTLVSKQMELQEPLAPEQKKWQTIVKYCLFAFFFMILGHTVLSLISFEYLLNSLGKLPASIDGRLFLLMLLCGFSAQMADGSLGMGYGTISTTFLLAIGINPAIVSSRVHAARVFSSGISGYSHHRFGNINKKLFRVLVVPGIGGAVVGATLAFFAQRYASYVRLPVSVYTLYLGYYILRKAFGKPSLASKVKGAGWLAAGGGFLDAFAGGGWGTLVTSTLLSRRRDPRYVIGSVCLAEFFVVLVSSLVFFLLLQSLPLWDIAGLILGGMLAAPLAARLAGKLPMKTMFMIVGAIVILASCNTLWKAVNSIL